MQKAKINSPATTKVAGGSLVFGSKKVYIHLTRPSFVGVYHVHRPFLDGMSSVINISGKDGVFDKYLQGNAILDMRHDWDMVGFSIREAMENIKKHK